MRNAIRLIAPTIIAVPKPQTRSRHFLLLLGAFVAGVSGTSTTQARLRARLYSSFLSMKNLLVMLLFVAVAAQAAIVQNSTTNISFQNFVPCANGGQGEIVDVHGQLQTVFTWTVANGVVSGIFKNTPIGMTGVGESTGLAYHFVGATQETFHIPVVDFPYGIYRAQEDFFLISQGGEPNLDMHETINFGFSSDGYYLYIFHDSFFVTCR